MASFTSRFAGSAPSLSWFPGHMSSASDNLVNALRRCDVVVEVRDARVPFSSANGLLDGIETVLGVRRPRVVVFNKCDLADAQLQPRLLKVVAAEGHIGLCISAGRRGGGGHVGRLLPLVDLCLTSKKMSDAARISSSGSSGTLPKAPPFKPSGAIMLVAGIPNVGKSTLINAVRLATQYGESRGARTGAAPGVTRQISDAMLVRKSPLLYMLDSPGLLPPRIPDAESGLRLLLTTAIPETLVAWSVQAEYLHFLLSAHRGGGASPNRQRHVDALGLPPERTYPGDGEGVERLLHDLAMRLGARLPGGGADVEVAARHMVRAFQTGALGRYTLDPVPK